MPRIEPTIPGKTGSRSRRHGRSRRRSALLAGAISLCCAALWSAQAQQPGGQESVDLELALAVDVSSSVDDTEFELQMRGIAEAFRNPDIIDAIRAAGNRGIAVSLIQWSGEGSQAKVVDWMVIDDGMGAADFARQVDNAPRKLIGGQTSIAGALAFAVDEIETNGYAGSRRVIDISGDGRANVGPHPMEARDAAVGAGITVNGLAIRKDEPFLDGYFSHSVIGGIGSFMMTAEDYEDYTAAILAKLLREIGIPLSWEDTDTNRRFAARD